MKNLFKHYCFVLCLVATFCLFAWRAVHYYINGQAIASAHMDGHFFAFVDNIFIAFILAIIVTVVHIVKEPKNVSKWFWIPAIIAVFAVIHLIFGGILFICCPPL